MRVLFLAVLLVACAVDPALAPRDCTPGQTAACACPGASGVQTCDEEGRLGACECSDAGSVPDVADVPEDRHLVTDASDVADAAPADVVDASVAPDVVTCEPRQTCGADCVTDYQSDPRHCGACFIRCQPSGPGTVPVCIAGRCSYACAPGMVPCGVNRCVDPFAPGFDCRRCGDQCPNGQTCVPINADRAECRPR